MTAVSIRPLGAADGDIYRTIRLRALRAHPEAFTSAYEDEVKRDAEAFGAMLATDRRRTVGAFRDGELVGVATLVGETGYKRRHRGSIVAVYVSPEARGAGLSRQMIAELIAVARSWSLTILELSVQAKNEPAQRVYRSLGFVPFGLKHWSVLIDGVYWDEALMELVLA